MKQFKSSGIGALVLITPLFGTSIRAQAIEPQVYTYRVVGADTLAVHVFTPDHPGQTTLRHSIALFHGGGWVEGAPTVSTGTLRFCERADW